MRCGVLGEHLSYIESIAELEDHHEAAAVDVNVHAADAGTPKAVEDFGPDAAVVLAVGGNGGGVVSKVHREDVAAHMGAHRGVLCFTGKVNVFSRICLIGRM